MTCTLLSPPPLSGTQPESVPFEPEGCPYAANAAQLPDIKLDSLSSEGVEVSKPRVVASLKTKGVSLKWDTSRWELLASSKKPLKTVWFSA